MALIKEESANLKTKFGDDRRTEISDQGEVEFHEEDLIPHARVVVTLSTRGFVKRVPAQLYSLQHRGGKGIVGMVTRDDDAVRLLTVADTHDNLLFFTNRGRVFRLRCFEIPESATRLSKGMAVINLFPIAETEKVTDIVAVTTFSPDSSLLLATGRGEIKKTASDKFAIVRSNGLIAMDVEEGDDLLAARLATEKDEAMMITQKGQSIRFTVSSLRSSQRTSGGVSGIKLGDGDRVVTMEVAHPDAFLLTVTGNGFGKLTPISEYPLQKRAGSGVRTFKLTDKTGDVVATKITSLTQQAMMISAQGMVIQTPVKEKDPKKGITTLGRSTQGVKLMNLEEGDKLVAVTVFD
jgi:DNA gyrase subunit A